MRTKLHFFDAIAYVSFFLYISTTLLFVAFSFAGYCGLSSGLEALFHAKCGDRFTSFILTFFSLPGLIYVYFLSAVTFGWLAKINILLAVSFGCMAVFLYSSYLFFVIRGFVLLLYAAFRKMFDILFRKKTNLEES